MEIVYWLRDKTVCFFSGHSWCEWRALERRTLQHAWQAWKHLSPYSCEETRTCQRCYSRESREFHQWGTWRADPFVPCHSMVSCSHCDAATCPELDQLHRLMGPIPIL